MDSQSPRPRRCPLNAQPSHMKPIVRIEEFEKIADKPIDRRTLLKVAGAGAVALASIASVTWMPKRAVASTPTAYSDIQFNISAFVHPAQTIAGLQVDFGVVYTSFSPVTLTRNPTLADQTTLWQALHTIEANYSFSPSGIFTFVSYGQPYFDRLPSSLVASHMPLRNDGSGKPVLEEAVPGPTDVSPLNPGITKANPNFHVPVQIEHNDILFTFRSDSLHNITDVLAWLQGSNKLNGNTVASPAFNGLLKFAPLRTNFVQPGATRAAANQMRFSFASQINPASPMWMGFVDQQVDASAPTAATVAFLGSHHGILTTAVLGDYFDRGSIMHLSHVIEDLPQFYSKNPNDAEPFSERIQYMFRSKQHDGTPGLPYPEDPNDFFTNGGGLGAPTSNLATQQQSAYVKNDFFGANDMLTNFDPAVLVDPVNPHKKYRVGHEAALQRSSRATDGVPLHIRNDGPGLSSLDVIDGSTQPTLEFTIFVPTSEFFRLMRVNSASLDFVKAGQGGGTATSVAPGIEAADANDDGLERFTTATRRQNFLIPPRRHRAFPLLELVEP
jgi:hypothetical protein